LPYGHWRTSATLFLSFLDFTQAVKEICNSNDSPDEAYADLQKAATVAGLEALAGLGVGGLAEAADDARIEVVEYYMTSMIWMFEFAFSHYIGGMAAAADDEEIELLSYYMSSMVWTLELASDSK
jgi:hypothetical protein